VDECTNRIFSLIWWLARQAISAKIYDPTREDSVVARFVINDQPDRGTPTTGELTLTGSAP